MYQMAAMGPRQTTIPDPTQGMFDDTAGMFAGMDGAMGPEKKYRASHAQMLRQVKARDLADKKWSEAMGEATGRGPAMRHAPPATDEQLMGTAMQGMQYFESFPELLQDPAAARRERAAAHGSLRAKRGFGPDDPGAVYSTDVDPQNLIGAGMAEELMSPARRRRIERERGSEG
jgi:hypothetical protein